MKKHIFGMERRILDVLREGLPRSQTPYKDMAQRIGIETSELLAILKDWKEQGKLRRIGAIVNHFKVGLPEGAMVVWQVESERIAEIGKLCAGFAEISHAYERQTHENWPYNLYTMIHGKNTEEVQKVVEHISQVCGVSNYRILVTEKELKKISPTYFDASRSSLGIRVPSYEPRAMIHVVGLNHKSAPIGIREKLAFDAADTVKALRLLKGKFPNAEFVLLSTCNRVELYSVSPSLAGAGEFDAEEIANFLSEFHGLALEDFREFLYFYRGSEAVRHLLMVASSLDSMLVGELQIIAQVKESYAVACRAKSTGKILNRLFHCSFSTSKKVHTITSISSGRISIAGVAIELAMQIFADVSSATAVVIGAGEMGELLVQHLLHVGCKDIVVFNRSHERAVDMAERYGVRGLKWEELNEQLITADIVVAAAGGQDYLFDKKSFKKITGSRKAGTLLIIDIAVPRNFEPAVNELENVYLYSIDDLSDVVEQNRKARAEDIAKGMRIVDKSASDFMDWFRAGDIGPLIGQMRQRFAQIGQKELNSFFAGPKQEDPCKKAAELMVKQIVNRLLHCVIKNVNLVAQKHGLAEAAKQVDSIIQQAEEISSGLDNNEER